MYALALKMPQQIKTTTDKRVQADAARALCDVLDTLRIPHVIIGGFAVSLYGSDRFTHDIDVLVDIAPPKIQDFLRPQVSQINKHFAQMKLKYYFAPMLMEGLVGEQLVLANDGNVLVETLATNALGLPVQIDPAMVINSGGAEQGSGLPTLHPSVLVLTKMKRWASISDSTFPPSVKKAGTDLQDIDFLIKWLQERNLKISVGAYNAAKPERLYSALKVYAKHLEDNRLTEKLDLFKQVLSAYDTEKMG